MNILMTGGSGLLGQEILKLDTPIISPTRDELDITDVASVKGAFETYMPDVVLHLAAATTPPAHQKNPVLGIETNIIGTANIALACARRGVRLVYTSTDYLYVGEGPHKENEPVLPPYNFAWSKLGGECSVALVPDHLIIRLSFGPAPFPWPQVYEGQYNSKLYVSEIAPIILALAKTVETGIMHVGGPRTSLEEYAQRTRPDVSTIPKPEWVPADTSLDISRMCKVLDISDPRLLFKYGS